VLGAAVVLGVGTLAACSSSGSAHPAAKRTTTKLATTTTTTAPVPTAPETGLPDPGGQSLTRPALWVKIENTPDARPQAGLASADVVYEQVTEGDITRFIALFNSDVPDVVGPIRSVRVMDADVVSPLGGIFAYSGGIPSTVALINAAPVHAVDEDAAGAAMFRDPNKYAPHNLFGRGPQLVALGGTPVPPPALFQYQSSTEQFSGDPVAVVSVGFPSGFDVQYVYDGASNTWKRSMAGVPFVDASGTQVAPTNIVVQFVNCCLDGFEGARYQTVGSGDAWIFSGGQLVKGTWQRSDRNQVTQFLDGAGQPIRLNPGRTWVELAPVGTPVGVIPGAAPATTTTTKAPATTKRTKRQ
jgi:Protein of unknown function (DUF3048) N-terminal domain/Protein of unknown function (DUF3048) C-terminal domain